MESKEIQIQTEFIKLVAFLKYAGICSTGGEASVRIENGEIRINGELCFMRGKKLHKGDTVTIGSQQYHIV